MSAQIASSRCAVRRIAEKEPLDGGERLEPPPSTRYVAIVNGAPGKPDERHAAAKLTADQAHRLEHEGCRLACVRHAQRGHVGRAADGCASCGAGIELDVHAHAGERHKDIGEQDRRVDPEPR